MEEHTAEELVEVSVSSASHNNTLCILCSTLLSVEHDKEQESDNDFFDKLVKFKEELNEVVFKSDSTKIPRRNTSLLSSPSKSAYRGSSNKSNKTVYRSKKMYKVCPNCKLLMTSAFTSKSQLDEVESHVRYLQGAVLTALKILDRHLKQFIGDLGEVSEVIKISTKDKHMVKAKGINRDLADVEDFRECILSAVTNLDQFRKGTQSKNVDKICNQRELHQNSPPEVFLPDDDNDNDANMITASQMETDNITDDYDDNWLPDHDDVQDDINDESDHEKLSRPKRRRMNPKKSSATPTQICSDLDLLKESPRAYIGKRLSSVLDEVTTSMSPFKAAIVRRTFNKTKRKPRQTEPEGPLAHHYVTYNDETDVLSVDNQVEIRFNEIELSLECSQCAYSCKGPPPEKEKYELGGNIGNTAEKKMMYHVLGKHMNVFDCEECDKPIASYHQYVKHRDIHKKMGSGSEPVCELCGKVLKSVESFEDHKWVHMTKEEREEARRQGKKDPADKFKQRPIKYQCQECGKGFRRPYELKNHMRAVHGTIGDEEEGEAETYLCGGCGVIFSHMGNLTKHLKLQRCKGAREDKGEKIKDDD